MPKKQPRYTIEVQRRAAEQVLCQHRPIAEVARQLHCSAASIQRWIKRHRKSLTTSPIIQPTLPPSSKSSFSRTTFLPLQVEGADMPSFVGSRIEIVTQSGLTLRFSGDTSPDLLIGLVQRLEVAPC